LTTRKGKVVEDDDFSELDHMLVSRLVVGWMALAIMLERLPLPITLPGVDDDEEPEALPEEMFRAAERTIDLVADQPIPPILKALAHTAITHWLVAWTLTGEYVETAEKEQRPQWMAAGAVVNLNYSQRAAFDAAEALQDLG
jgi:hypothetical protein